MPAASAASSPDRPFGNSVVTTSYKIGVDGGGTKTELILIDSAGEIIARHIVAGCNPSHTGPELARTILQNALHELRSHAKIGSSNSVISTTHLYMAGHPRFWQETAAQLSGCGRVLAAPDSLPVLELATQGAPGLVLHAGTGSFIAARAPDGTVHYAGGLGWKLGDPGSAFDLGRRGIARALLELQGWVGRSPLADALCAHTGLTDANAITRLFYSEPDANARIAAFAPRVTALAGEGSHDAQLALVQTLTELVEQALSVTDKLFAGKLATCGISGALLNSEPAVHTLRSLVTTHAWPVGLCFLTEPPIEGVRRLLAKSH